MKLSIALMTLGVALLHNSLAHAQTRTLKIGSLSDQSGVLADSAGPGSTLAAQLAVEDSGLVAKGWKIDVISGDHRNRPELGTSIARRWLDIDKVDVIVDLTNSSVALAVNQVVKE
jgi:branched-chain amino acid transport system substrate-binding protein